MAAINGNAAYLSWNSVDVSGYWTGQVSYDASVDLEDVSHGASAEYKKYAPKLKDTTMKFVIIYDDTTQTYFTSTDVGTIGTLTWAPEGNTAGNPVFTSEMILKSMNMTQSQDKEFVVFNLEFALSDADPTARIEDGDTV